VGRGGDAARVGLHAEPEDAIAAAGVCSLNYGSRMQPQPVVVQVVVTRLGYAGSTCGARRASRGASRYVTIHHDTSRHVTTRHDAAFRRRFLSHWPMIGVPVIVMTPRAGPVTAVTTHAAAKSPASGGMLVRRVASSPQPESRAAVSMPPWMAANALPREHT
jgi:hypothetical protein